MRPRYPRSTPAARAGGPSGAGARSTPPAARRRPVAASDSAQQRAAGARRGAHEVGRHEAGQSTLTRLRMSTTRPNIVLIHSHDTGRYVQPYGHQLTTPNIQRLADQGLLFRQAFAAAPNCSPSRCRAADRPLAALQRDDRARAPRVRARRPRPAHHPHAARRPATGPRWSGSSTSPPIPEELGYDLVADADTSHAHHVAPAAVALLRERPPQPFFLSVGFFETHRDYFEPTSVRDALYSRPAARTCPTRPSRGATWRRSSRAPARSTTASARS